MNFYYCILLFNLLVLMSISSILQWNIRGLRANSEELKIIFNEYDPSIICLQETMINRLSYNLGLNYSFYGSLPVLGNRATGGSAIVVKSNITHEFLPLRTAIQAVAIKVTLKKQYTICSVYLEPGSQITIQDLQDLINQLPHPFLILGDLNAHSPLWFSDTSNNMGKLIEQLFQENDISILNDNCPTYFNTYHNSTSIIDLGLCSSTVFADFIWSVTEDLHGSDHFPVLVKLAQPLNVPSLPKWNLDKADWNKFYQESIKINNIISIDSHLEAYDALERLIISAANKSIPQSKPSKGKPHVPWFDSKCKILRKITLTCYDRYRANSSNINKIVYKRALARKRKYFKEAKRKSWQDYISQIDTNTPVTKVWNKIRKLSGKYVPPPLPSLNVDDDLIYEPTGVAEELAKHFSNVSSKNNYTTDFINRDNSINFPNFSSQNTEYYNQPFQLREFNDALSNTKNTSPGEDSIKAEMIKRLPNQTIKLLLGIYNKIWTTGTLPTSWKSSVIVPINKPGKDPKLTTSYRPIALTSVLCKIFERMVNLRLIHYLESKNLLSHCQYGFRKNCSTLDPLLKLSTTIQNAFIQKKHTIGIFFDLEKAYDTTWRKGILLEMYKLKLRGNLPIFIQNFLTDRCLKVRIGDTYSTLQPQEEGVPQGSVLSVVLFLIAINGII